MSMLVPPWLESLLSTDFFSFCATHKDAYPSRSECNMFCLDCHDDSFCFYCRSTQHKDHRVIQIRRSSYHDVVRLAEIEKVLDIRGVQTYVINSAKVLFLNERPQPKIINNITGKGSTPSLCEVCSRSLLDQACCFCSLGCKLAGMKKNGDLRFVILSKKPDHEITGRRERMSINRRLPVKEDDQDQQLRESNIQQNKVKYQSEPSQPHNNSNSRRRKGIPRRAPLGP
ncbi:hypothetical protein I3843_14G106900 [Carya illinoinensis]|nr:hypothetical protein I3760_14G108300 [Carya illinoinensis]KAG7947701.1 hypothetical protein I3843_14G106900 [Carya illinoinensis]KAG7947702.1 hypothetical protein I3843_14G106900 [Carya illinoinensis]